MDTKIIEPTSDITQPDDQPLIDKPPIELSLKPRWIERHPYLAGVGAFLVGLALKGMLRYRTRRRSSKPPAKPPASDARDAE